MKFWTKETFFLKRVPSLKISQNHLLYFFILLFLYILLRTAWVSDDAFLTIRSVDNFTNGYGLRWNILERVQIYTHPLWMFVLSSFYYFIQNPLITFYSTSIIISLATVYLFAITFVKSSEKLILGFTILLFSKSFIEYSTSGLENPLTHLLILFFFMAFLKEDNFSLKKVFTLFFIASLIASNRMDTFLILIPALLHTLIQKRSFRTILYASLGFSPFLLWEVFSIIYYGVPFPNTAYAKLATGIDSTLLIEQGFYYFRDSLLRDPVTLIIILTGTCLAFFSRKTKDVLISTGILLYLIYIIQIGGDFMSGRFFSALLLIATILIMRFQFPYHYSQKLKLISYIIVLFLLQSFYTYSPYFYDESKNRGIADERAVYYPATGLLNVNWDTLEPDYYSTYNGIDSNTMGKKKTIRPSSGIYAFYAGTDVHVVDTFGLGDALLSHLPPIEQKDFRVGHFIRAVPAGYWKFDRSFGNEIEDKNLHKYYEKLSVLIHGERLITSERIIIIWRMNTGYYDYLLDAYTNAIDSH